MSKVCKECNGDLPTNGNYVTCRGGCKQGYHFDCTTISQQTFNTRSKADKEAWRCQNCRKGKRKPTSSDEEKESESMIKEILSRVAQMQIDIKNNYDALKIENEELKHKIDKLIKNNGEKDAKINELNIRVNELEQYSRRDQIEIYGIEESENENLQNIIIEIAEKIGVEIKDEDIHVVHRLGKIKKDKKPRAVIAKMQRKKTEEIINKRKPISLQGYTNNIYINEAMSPFFKDLWWKAKNQARDMGYRYVWFKRGKLLVRKNEGNRPIRIQSEEDIEKYIC